MGVGVSVAGKVLVGVGVIEGVKVGRGVRVIVGVNVAVAVSVWVEVGSLVEVIVGVLVGSGARNVGYAAITRINPIIRIVIIIKLVSKNCLRLVSSWFSDIFPN